MKEEIKWRERDEHGSEGGIWRELFFYLQDDETFHMKFKNFQLTTLCSSCRLVRHTKKNNEYERSESIKAENGFWGFMQACNMLKEKTFTRQNAARCFLMCSLMDFFATYSVRWKFFAFDVCGNFQSRVEWEKNL